MRNPPQKFLWLDLFRRKPSDQTTVADVLRENVLFRTLAGRELKYLTSLVYERVYHPGEAIFKQNDRGLGMYVIAKGKVAIMQGDVLVTTLTEGSFFGELALVDPDNIRSAGATATERTVLIGFTKRDLMEVLERKPSMGVKVVFQLSTVLGKRLLETTDKIAALTQKFTKNDKAS